MNIRGNVVSTITDLYYTITEIVIELIPYLPLPI